MQDGYDLSTLLAAPMRQHDQNNDVETNPIALRTPTQAIFFLGDLIKRLT